mmetsp:Transcript_2011/g.4622  ORF Transcript_2011/g.4622 Transcript_2011/m.4622 type:complete len:318 (-) Transcript_2011:1337-2290(-)
MTSIVHFHTVDVMKTSSQASLEWTTTETQQRSLDNNDLQIRPHIRRGEGGTDPTTTRGKIKSSIMSTDKSSILVLLLIFVFCVSVWVVVKLYRRWCTCIQPQGQDEDEQRPEEDDSDLSSSIVKKTKQIEVAIQRQNCSMIVTERDIIFGGSSNSTQKTDSEDDDDDESDLESQIEMIDKFKAKEVKLVTNTVPSASDFDGRSVNCVSGDDDDYDDDDSFLRLPRGHQSTVHNLCAICIESYKQGDNVIWSSNNDCIHCFHRECFVRAASTATVKLEKDDPLCLPCPVCRQTFLNLYDPPTKIVDDNSCESAEQDSV